MIDLVPLSSSPCLSLLLSALLRQPPGTAQGLLTCCVLYYLQYRTRSLSVRLHNYYYLRTDNVGLLNLSFLKFKEAKI